MDDTLKETIKKIVQLTQQNPEFGVELREALKIESSASSVSINDQRLDDIYEYCLAKILRKQAEEFYKDFPLDLLVPELIEDFIRMENYRRNDNFRDFCLALYQQIEGITNYLCNNRDLIYITSKMWTCPCNVKSGKDIPTSIDNRSGKNIASFIFYGINKNTQRSYAEEKSRLPLNELYAMDKVCVVIYFVGYQAMMKNSDFENYKNIKMLIDDIYQCRNLNHRGCKWKDNKKEHLKDILQLTSFHYCEYIGVLTQFVSYIKEGYASLQFTKEYADTL